MKLGVGWSDAGRRSRCSANRPPLRKSFPGFPDTFRKTLVYPDASAIAFTMEKDGEFVHALEGDSYGAFQRVVDIYSEAHARLASRDYNRPDVVLMCIPDEVLGKISSVERKPTETEQRRAKELQRVRASRQLDLFAMLDEVEE